MSDDLKVKNDAWFVRNRISVYAGDDSCKPVKWFIYDEERIQYVDSGEEVNLALLRPIQEIFDNIQDNCIRSREANVDPGNIYVDLDNYSVRIKNEGLPFSIKPHESSTEENLLLIPRVALTVMRSSSNYADGDSKTIGQNGVGIKLATYLASKMKVHCIDAVEGQEYRLRIDFEDIDPEKCEPNIEERITPGFEYRNGKWRRLGRGDYDKSSTSITWDPDFSLFGLRSFTPMIMSHIRLLAICCSFYCGVPLILDGGKPETFKLKDILEMLFDPEDKLFPVKGEHKRKDCPTTKYTIVITSKPNNGFIFSMVNGSLTPGGGIHVNAVINAIKRALKAHDIVLTPSMIAAHLGIFISVKGSNPTYDTQTKVKLTAIGAPSRKKAGEKKKGNYTEICMKGLQEGIQEDIVKWKSFKMFKKEGDIKGIRDRETAAKNIKLDMYTFTPSNKTGHNTVCIFDEGGSAGHYTGDLRSCIKRGCDLISIFHLGGKILNVRDMTLEAAAEKKIFAMLVKIFNFEHDVDYRLEENAIKLNCGYIWITTDADHDGAHIRALVINLIMCFWPSFVEAGRLCIFMTPIIRVYMKNEIWGAFYTEAEYEKNKHEIPQVAKIRYCKGLASSTTEDAQYDANNPRIIRVRIDEETNALLNMAFSDHFIAERKDWMMHCDIEGLKFKRGKDGCCEQSVKNIFNSTLLPYTHYSLKRAIAAIDGLKDVWRRILYIAMTRLKINEESSVAQFAGVVSLYGHYLHGDMSMQNAIIELGQHYPCSNNLPLMYCIGQAGSRLDNEHGSGRYVRVKLPPWTRFLYRMELLEHLEYEKDEKGHPYCPKTMVGLLPIVVINGILGIATGFSTNSPPHNFDDVVDMMLYISKKTEKGIKIEEEETPPMRVHFRGFKGRILINEKRRKNWVIDENGEEVREDIPIGHVARGEYTKDVNKITITEIPPNVKIAPYCQFLKDLETKGRIKKLVINANPNSIEAKFTIVECPENLKNGDGTETEQKKLEPNYRSLRLQRNIGIRGITVLVDDRPRIFSSIVQYMIRYYKYVIKYIDKYLESEIVKNADMLDKLELRIKCIIELSDGTLVLKGLSAENQKKALVDAGYLPEFVRINEADKCIENIEQLQEKIKETQAILEDLNSINAHIMYRRWLRELLDNKSLKKFISNSGEGL